MGAALWHVTVEEDWRRKRTLEEAKKLSKPAKPSQAKPGALETKPVAVEKTERDSKLHNFLSYDNHPQVLFSLSLSLCFSSTARSLFYFPFPFPTFLLFLSCRGICLVFTLPLSALVFFFLFGNFYFFVVF